MVREALLKFQSPIIRLWWVRAARPLGYFQSEPRVLPKWTLGYFQMKPRVLPKWPLGYFQSEPRVLKVTPRVFPNWAQSTPKVTPRVLSKWNQSTPKVTLRVLDISCLMVREALLKFQSPSIILWWIEQQEISQRNILVSVSTNLPQGISQGGSQSVRLIGRRPRVFETKIPF